MSESKKVAVFGLGSMGYGMAQSCLRAGHVTYGFDIASEPMTRFQAEGGAKGPLETVAADLDAVVVVVLNAAQTEAVLFGDNGIARHLTEGTVILASATVPPSFARDMEARCAELGLLYLDAPISGGSIKAAAGQLSIMASGTAEAFEAAGPILDAMAEKVFDLGRAAGPASAMKSVNQLLAGVHIAAMAEAMTFGMTQGISPEAFMEVIPQCAGTSWMLENRGPHIVSGDYTPHSQVNIWPKDLGIVLNSADEVGFDAPITKAALGQYKAAADMGLGREDDAAVAKVYASASNLKLPGAA